jgi:hypothetical protein
MIASTSCPNCTKPFVLVAQLRYPHDVNEPTNRIIFVVNNSCEAKTFIRKIIPEFSA